MFYNHATDAAEANAEWAYIDGRLMVYRALRDIEPGEEITFDYGEDTGF